MEDDISVEIIIDPKSIKKFYPLNEDINGYISFIPKRDLKVDALGYRFIRETRGTLAVKESVLHEEYFLTSETMYQSEKYTFPIKINNKHHESYSGKNLSYLLKIEPYLRLNQESKKGLIASYFSSAEDHAKPLYLYFKDKEAGYRVVEEPLKLAATFPGGNILAYSFLFLIALAGYLITTDLSSYTFIIFIIATFLFFYVLDLFFTFAVIGKIEGKISNSIHNKIQINLENNWKWKNALKLKVNYFIIEEVTDNRGTTPTLSEEIIFRSPTQSFAKPTDILSTTLDFPENEPVTFRAGYERIYWKLNITITTWFDLKYDFKEEFIVMKYKVKR